MKIEIYDPAMCCPTGVCGPSVDPELIRIQETLRQIRKQAPEVQVERYSLTTNPQAFVSNPAIGELLKNDGMQCFPLAFVDGKLIEKGRYPANDQMAALLKQAGHEVSFGESQQEPCACGAKCC